MSDELPGVVPVPGPSRRERVFVDLTALRLDAGFRVQWFGQIGTAIGRETARVALPLQVYLVTGSLAAVGLLAVVQLAPTLVFSLYGGALADAADRRLVLVVTQALLAAISVALAALAVVPDASLLALFALAFIQTGLAALEHPARQASIPRLVPAQRLAPAFALTALNYQTSSIVGPAFAGVLIAAYGLSAAYALMVAGYLWAIVASFRMPRLPPAGEVRRVSLGVVLEGLSFVRRERIVLSTFAIDLIAMIFGTVVALFPVLALDVYRVGPEGVGLLAAARGSGAFAAGVFAGWASHVVSVGRVVLLAVAAYAVSIALFGAAPLFPLALFLIACSGATDLISAVGRNTLVQTVTPDALRGRVTAVHVLVVTSGPRIGDVRATLVAEALRSSLGIATATQVSIVTGGLLAMLGVAAFARYLPELARHRMTR